MNVSMPSEAVVPTLDGPVLVALAKITGPVTGRQVHQLTGLGSEAVSATCCPVWLRQGIVRASPVGSAVLYAINREHIAWPAAQALAGLRGELLARRAGRLGSAAAHRRAVRFGRAR